MKGSGSSQSRTRALLWPAGALAVAFVAAIQALGYRQVTIDPRGYRMGSLNEGVILRVAG